jgi:hypothetical protein
LTCVVLVATTQHHKISAQALIRFRRTSTVLASFTARQILIGILCSRAMTEASTGRQPVKRIRFECSTAQKAITFDDKSFIIFVLTAMTASTKPSHGPTSNCILNTGTQVNAAINHHGMEGKRLECSSFFRSTAKQTGHTGTCVSSF